MMMIQHLMRVHFLTTFSSDLSSEDWYTMKLKSRLGTDYGIHYPETWKWIIHNHVFHQTLSISAVQNTQSAILRRKVKKQLENHSREAFTQTSPMRVVSRAKKQSIPGFYSTCNAIFRSTRQWLIWYDDIGRLIKAKKQMWKEGDAELWQTQARCKNSNRQTYLPYNSQPLFLLDLILRLTILIFI